MDNVDFPAGKGSIDFDSNWLGERRIENSPELATGKPLYGINHLVAHVGVGVLEGTVLPPIFGALLVSGGHTEILKVTSLTNDVQLLGATIDDAAGEAYDKTARLLGLGYPGGPAIDKAAKEGVPFPARAVAAEVRGLCRTTGQAPEQLLLTPG